jgi:hypothetical protein
MVAVRKHRATPWVNEPKCIPHFPASPGERSEYIGLPEYREIKNHFVLQFAQACARPYLHG